MPMQRQQQQQHSADYYETPSAQAYMHSRPNNGSGSSGSSNGQRAQKENEELRALLRANLMHFMETQEQNRQRAHNFMEARGRLTKQVENLTYVVYATLAVVVFLALLSLVLCYKFSTLASKTGSS